MGSTSEEELLPKRLDECICENVGGHQEFGIICKAPHSNVSLAACTDVDVNRGLLCSVSVGKAIYDTYPLR